MNAQQQQPCRGALSYDDRDLGLNNQLQSLTYMLCVAHMNKACSVHAPPLGYRPCGTHLPGKRTSSGCIVESNATVDVLDLITLEPEDAILLQRGMHTNVSQQGQCHDKEPNMGGCGTCGPYNVNPFKCIRNKIDEGTARQHMLYPYGLRYHMRSRLRPFGPVCPFVRMRLSPLVEAYTRALMARLQLEPGRFVAAQLRAGWAFRLDAFKRRMEWACYGMATINSTLSKMRSMDYMPSPLFLLTNARKLHEAGIPVPIQILSEVRIASLAHTVLLNPMSSFQETVRQLGTNITRFAKVNRHDVVDVGGCGCTAADEESLGGRDLRTRQHLCQNATAFRNHLNNIKRAEKRVIENRREKWAKNHAPNAKPTRRPSS